MTSIHVTQFLYLFFCDSLCYISSNVSNSLPNTDLSHATNIPDGKATRTIIAYLFVIPVLSSTIDTK